ncbi:MAG: hypothetical protein ACOY3J_01035 [Bacillota bacterium]|nr:hypothetical protein [Thermanaerosceptrum fracticalcis]
MQKPIPYWKDPQFPLYLEDESPSTEETDNEPKADEDLDDIPIL